jgi:hypothetical protein
MKKYYIKDGLLTVGDIDAIPIIPLIRKVNQNGIYEVYFLNDPENIIVQGKFNDFCDENGIAYQDIESFESSVRGIGVSRKKINVSEGGGGEAPLNAITNKDGSKYITNKDGSEYLITK